jgi:hypothetical protein
MTGKSSLISNCCSGSSSHASQPKACNWLTLSQSLHVGGNSRQHMAESGHYSLIGSISLLKASKSVDTLPSLSSTYEARARRDIETRTAQQQVQYGAAVLVGHFSTKDSRRRSRTASTILRYRRSFLLFFRFSAYLRPRDDCRRRCLHGEPSRSVC